MKKYLSFAILATNLLFGQINIFENFDSSNTTATGFSGGSINTSSVNSCTGNNSYNIAAIPFVPQTIYYESPETIITNSNLNFEFNYKYFKSGGGQTLEVSYKLYNQNNQMYYSETLPIINMSSQNNNCLSYSQIINKSKITQNNSSIKFTFKFSVSNDGLGFSYFFIDNFKLLQTNNLSTNEVSKQNELLIYPNPTNKDLNIERFDINSKNIKIFDLNGKLLINKNIDNKNKLSIDVESLLKGIYILQIDNVKTKFIKN